MHCPACALHFHCTAMSAHLLLYLHISSRPHRPSTAMPARASTMQRAGSSRGPVISARLAFLQHTAAALLRMLAAASERGTDLTRTCCCPVLPVSCAACSMRVAACQVVLAMHTLSLQHASSSVPSGACHAHIVTAACKHMNAACLPVQSECCLHLSVCRFIGRDSAACSRAGGLRL